jgi:hypothetical protein
VEEAEGRDQGSAGAEVTCASGVDPVAVALALGGASRDKADAFLEEQRAVAAKRSSLIDIQKHYLHEQFKHLQLSVCENTTSPDAPIHALPLAGPGWQFMGGGNHGYIGNQTRIA